MRLKKSWVVAKKDLAEFKTNKYVIFTLIFMPIVMSVFMPIIYSLPIRSMGSKEQMEPNDIILNLNFLYKNQSIKEAVLNDSNINNVNLIESIVNRSLIINSTLAYTFVNNSVLQNVSLEHSIIANSNLKDVNSMDDTILKNSVIIGGENEELKFTTQMLLNLLLLFFIMIPAIIPTILASYSFVGEKINKSLEPLLATPTSDLELLIGKCASIFIPTMMATWFGFVACSIIIDFLTYPVLGYYPVPNAVWLIGILFLAPLFCILSISVNVLVSSRVSDVRASQQIGSLVVLPLVAFFIISMSGLFTLSILSMLAFSLLLLAVDAAVLYLALKVFGREEILVRWK